MLVSSLAAMLPLSFDNEIHIPMCLRMIWRRFGFSELLLKQKPVNVTVRLLLLAESRDKVVVEGKTLTKAIKKRKGFIHVARNACSIYCRPSCRLLLKSEGRAASQSDSLGSLNA